jgi:S1-C subfamily serine protease
MRPAPGRFFKSPPIMITRPIALSAMLTVLALVGGLPGRGVSGPAPGDMELEASILRVRPAVVLISSQVSAEVTIDCGTGPAQTVRPDPHYETGSGFVVHPSGYVATNGHVVAAFYEMNDRSFVDDFVKAGVEKACGPGLAMLPDGVRKARLDAIASDPRNRGRAHLTKELQVHLSDGKTYAAEVLAYSPAINPNAPARPQPPAGRDMGPMEPSGKDIALLKIAETDLPAVALARSSAGLLVGEQLFVIGYPGVVLNHDFLSKKSALDASVTVGRVSGFKTDITDRRVIQTDAAISWGNSGGPAFNRRGEVIGVATFISTTLEGDQAVQGFNFLIPVETVQEFASRIGLTPTAESPFMQAWGRAVTRFFQGEYAEAIQAVDAAERLRPGFVDVARLGTEARMRQQPAGALGRFDRRLGVGLLGSLGLVLLLLGVRRVVRYRLDRLRGVVPRVAPADVRAKLQAGSPVTLIDARTAEDIATSPLQAAGALHYVPPPNGEALRVRVAPDGEVIAYCT